MAKLPAGPAKLYFTTRTDMPFRVVYTDPLQREKSGRAKRIDKSFADEIAATAYQAELNKQLVTEGTAGVQFTSALRADALAAREHLDVAGHSTCTLHQLAQRYTTQMAGTATKAFALDDQVKLFLEDKEWVDGASEETVKNLKIRLWLWIDLARISTVGEISRDSVECLRTRQVSAQTRKNDLAAASNFCTWLVDKRRLDHHPLKGLRRPKVHHGKKPTLTAEECAAVLRHAGAQQATLAVMIFAGARPSELAETRLIYEGTPWVRIEGGKLKGRANRVTPMLPALRAFLAAAGDPAQVTPLSRWEREHIGSAAGITWKPDICRHTYISYRLQLAQNDALVAREAGTSEGIIYRHYHGLKTQTEARAWAALQPGKALTPVAATPTVG